MINGNGEQVTVLQASPIEIIDAIAEDALFVPRLMSPGNVDMIGKLCTSMSDLRAQMGKLEGTLVGYRRELSEQRSEISKLKRRVQELSEQAGRAGAA
jgi:archaellum component FlaC